MNISRQNNLTNKIIMFLLCVALVLSVANFSFSKIETGFAAYEYYSTDGIETKTEALEQANQKNIEVMQEGIVLLKNEDNCLPLKENAKVSVFGKNSINLVTGLSGSSSGGSTTGKVTLYNSLSNNDITFNPTLKSFYDNNSQSGTGRQSSPSIGSVNYGVKIGETPQTSYTQAVKDSYAEYDDAAIVVFSRMGGEGWDLTRTMRTSASTTSTAIAGARSATDHYLQLDQNEADLLKALDADPNIKNIVVLLNSANTMEVGFLDDPSHYAYSSKIKSALQVCLPGTSGAEAIGEILSGKINPSGRLADTFARDFTKDPTYQNFGNNKVADGNKSGGGFVHYDEDIYMGYRYYETRGYTDGEPWYDDNVVYPFGHGLSYTNFSWQLINQTPAQNSVLTKDGTITATVRVTNIGSVAGKDVVELYYTAPYTEGGISKSHVVLGAFEKTKTLEPNESQDVILTLKVSDMYSYDWSDANGNSFKGYELDSGNYTINLAKNAHCNTQITANDSASIKISYSVPAGGFQYDKDTTTGADVQNLYDDISGTGKTNSAPFMGVRQYLSRDDWDGTWPTNMAVKKSTWGSQSGASIQADSEDVPWYSATAPTQAETVGTNESRKVKIWHLTGRDYDDPLWDALLDQLTVGEMRNLVGEGAFTTLPITTIDKDRTVDPDGPFGFTSQGSSTNPSYNGNVFGTCIYCSPVVLAQSFNKELAYELGVVWGIEGLIGNGSGMEYSGIYATGNNTHRSQFGGRNGEYYSEDPYLTGIISAHVVKGLKSKGVYTYLKHFFLNDQETSREGLITWVSEQAIREIYARAFEIAVKVGGSTAIMTGFNRIGKIPCGQNYTALTSMLREEWGFNGMVITDWADGNAPTDNAIRAGCDLQLRGPINGGGKPAKAPSGTYAATQTSVLRKATKNILYATANSNIIQNKGGSAFKTSYSSGQKLTAVKDSSFSFSVANASNGINDNYNYAVTSGNLPQGMILQQNGTLSGTPNATGTSTFTITASDPSDGALYKYTSASTTYSVEVVATAPTGITFNDNTILAGASQVEYNFSIAKAYTMNGSNMDFSGFTYSIAGGSLPTGLTLAQDGTISGTPTEIGEFVFTAMASKGASAKTMEFTLNIREFYIGFTTTSLSNGTVGQAYSVDLSLGTEGNAQNVTYALKSGSTLPKGLTLAQNGTLSGTPSQAISNCKFVVVASSDDAVSEEVEFDLTINGIIFDSQNFKATINKNASFELNASTNGSTSSAITFAVSSGKLPSGMTMNSQGVISGKPNTLGTYVFNITASADGYADTVTTVYIVVAEQAKAKKGCGSISTEGTLFGIGAMLTALVVVGFVSSKKKQTNN